MGGVSERGQRRITEIDSVRGLALCGILVPNIVAITGMPTRGAEPAAGLLYESVFHQRFFPIFSFLFGLSGALFLRSAARRSDEPRAILLSRLAFLVPIGAAHQLLQPGEVLLPYAVVGIAVLLPATFLPREAVLALGSLATVAAVTLTTGGSLLIPGLFLLGLATARYDVPETLGDRTKWITLAFAVSTLAAVPLNALQMGADLTPSVSHVPAIAGLVTAAAYTTGLVLLLLCSPAARPLAAFLGPLGRMALTNYLSATVLIVLADLALHLERGTRYGTVLALAAAILAVQAAFSGWWLTRFRYGPAEWAWRCLTWWEFVRTTAPAGRAGGIVNGGNDGKARNKTSRSQEFP